MNCNWLISVRRFGSTEEPANEIYVTRELGSGIQPMLELLDYRLPGLFVKESRVGFFRP
jgi:hypothetical protein